MFLEAGNTINTSLMENEESTPILWQPTTIHANTESVNSLIDESNILKSSTSQGEYAFCRLKFEFMFIKSEVDDVKFEVDVYYTQCVPKVIRQPLPKWY